MRESAHKVLLVLFLGFALAASGVHAKTQATWGKMSLAHSLPMDGTLPVATHWHKGGKWVPMNGTGRGTAPAKPRSLLSTAASMPKILGLPSSCISQTRCCGSTAGLSRVPTSKISTLPYSSVVLVALSLEQNDGTRIVATCTGTLALRSNIVLTAGHCVTEITGENLFTQALAAVVYFGVRGGTYSKAVKVVSYSTFADWANDNIEVADHALLKLQSGQSGHVYKTSDITHRFSHTKGYKEPFTSVGFPGGGAYGSGGVMYYTPNPHRNQCMGLYASGSDVSGTFGIQLAIHEGMSGGPVLNTQGVIVATNSFSLIKSGCPALCYNGYTPIDNTNYPLSKLIALLP